MQAKKAAILRRAWSEKPCEHLDFEIVYIIKPKRDRLPVFANNTLTLVDISDPANLAILGSAPFGDFYCRPECFRSSYHSKSYEG